jgi:hypothetical protein
MAWRSSQRAWTGLAVPIAGLIGATLFEATDKRQSFLSRLVPIAYTDAAVKSDLKVCELIKAKLVFEFRKKVVAKFRTLKRKVL